MAVLEGNRREGWTQVRESQKKKARGKKFDWQYFAPSSGGYTFAPQQGTPGQGFGGGPPVYGQNPPNAPQVGSGSFAERSGRGRLP